METTYTLLLWNLLNKVYVSQWVLCLVSRIQAYKYNVFYRYMYWVSAKQTWLIVWSTLHCLCYDRHRYRLPIPSWKHRFLQHETMIACHSVTRGYSPALVIGAPGHGIIHVYNALNIIHLYELLERKWKFALTAQTKEQVISDCVR